MTAHPQDSQHELVGAILSRRYQLQRVIGSGGMGTVFEADSRDDGQRVAVKLLASAFREDAEVKARFAEEGRLCQRLVHPNIVRVLDVGEAEDGSPYVVMELLEGAPLSTYTRGGARVPLAQAAAILQGVLAGLAAAHAQGIVHRDLKPDNVVLARDPSGSFTPRILDFGIAKVMDQAGGVGQRTRTGMLLGTPAYMSPEQVRSAKDVDPRTDLWSAGVLLYELVTGRVAFPAPTEYARLAAVLSAKPTPVAQVDPELGRITAFLDRALRKDPAERYASALDMARALAAAVPTEASPHGAMADLPGIASVWRPAPAASAAPAPAAAASSPGTLVLPPVAPRREPTNGPGGTLASRAGRAVVEPAPQVAVATQGTLPSESLPMLSGPGRRGVPAWLVAVLVVVALAAGFALGLAAARLG